MSILTLQDANGVNRENVIVEPVNPNGKWILSLHGGYGSPDQMKATTALQTLFPEHYICFAQGDKILADANGNLVHRGWRLKDEEKVDNRFLSDLLEEFLKQYGLSYKNGGIISASNGAMAAMRLLSHIDEMSVDFLVSVSGTYNSPEDFDFTGRILTINHQLDSIVPYSGSAIYEALDVTIEKFKDSAEVLESILLNKKLQDPNSTYHTWDELKSIYPNFDQRLKLFVG
ncbi:MAG: hypothetical protein PQ612_06085 [Rickettsiales bacterium]|nr:hypothetical protein [Pseudomonadota bacterium]MDA0966893.1 hypothetical protein [Pseudomonadota bacterium]MDG4543568.1 hypothetical protein [Rickettsiales bacterium]MDG4545716.1 hypothetical protein [Rickettsiales bacterium]MDG4547511.1 hypothetical protein [Rickettsiales bacterium]